MTRRVVSFIFATAVLGTLLGVGPTAVAAEPPTMLGPGDAKVSNIKDEALIRWSQWGFVYIAGQQDSPAHGHLRGVLQPPALRRHRHQEARQDPEALHARERRQGH